MLIIWNISGIFTNAILNKLYVLVIFTIPLLSLTVVYMSEESVVDMVITVIRYIFSYKIYIHVLKENTQIVLSKDTKEKFKVLGEKK